MHQRRNRPCGIAIAVTALLAVIPGCTPPDGGQGAAERTPEETLADSLVDAWIEAAGGMESWEEARTLRFTIMTVWYDSVGEIRRMRPRRVEMRKAGGAEQARIERPEAEGLYVQVFNGDTAWATLNERPIPVGDKAADETEYVARDAVYWIGLPFKLRDPGVNRSARQTDEGYEVRVTFGDDIGAHPGDRYFYYFLDDDPFPEQVHYVEQGKEEVDRNRTHWSNFVQVGSMVYVGSRLWVDTLGNPTKELRIDDVWVNPDLSEALFTPPGR